MSENLTAAEAEATDKPIEVLFRGTTYVVPAPLDWPYDTLDHLSSGRISLAVDGLLGDEQLARFKETKPRLRDAVALMEEISKASGSGELGN